MGICKIQKQTIQRVQPIVAPQLKLKPQRIVWTSYIVLLAEHSQQNQFISISTHGLIQTWNVLKGTVECSILLQENMFFGECKFQSYGKSYGCLKSLKTLRILAVKTFKQIRKITNNIARISRVSFQGVEINQNKQLYSFNPTNGITTASSLEYYEIDYSLDGQYLAYTTVDLINLVKLKNKINQRIKWSLRDGFSQRGRKTLQFSPDSKYLIYAIKYFIYGVINVHQSPSLELLWEIRGVIYYSISKDSKYLVISTFLNDQESTKLYNIINGQFLYALSNRWLFRSLLLQNRLIGTYATQLTIYGYG